jgi:hypothetical protein
MAYDRLIERVSSLRKRGIPFRDATSRPGTSSRTNIKQLSNPKKIDGRKGSLIRVHNK